MKKESSSRLLDLWRCCLLVHGSERKHSPAFILLPIFRSLSTTGGGGEGSGRGGARASGRKGLRAQARTRALLGPPWGEEEPAREQEGGASHPRFIHVGPRVRGAAGTPRKRLEGAFGARFRLRCLAGAATSKPRDRSARCNMLLLRSRYKMPPTEIYLDHNVIVDALEERRGSSLSAFDVPKREKCIFPFSPFHLEEVAMILQSDASNEQKGIHIYAHLDAITLISESWEYVPGNEGPIQLIREHPLKSLNNRVLNDYSITDECIGVEEFHDSMRSQKHFEAYASKIGIEPKGLVPTRDRLRADHGIDEKGISHLEASEVLFDRNVSDLMLQKMQNYDLSIESLPKGAALRQNHDLTRRTVDCLMRVLNDIGYYADKPGRHRSYMFDVGHTIYATRASTFVVGDERLFKRASAIYHFLDAETKILSPTDFLSQWA